MTPTADAPADLRTLGIIPARGGSKGLPRKNLAPLCGLPLIGWTIRQAAASEKLTRCIVSSDDEEIIAVARSLGAEAPFTRPAEHATDGAAASQVVLHALDWLEARGDTFDMVAWLEPTSPLRKTGDIDRAITMLAARPDCDSVVSVSRVHTEHPHLVKRIDAGLVKPYVDPDGSEPLSTRQQLEPAYFPYGVIYLTRVRGFRAKKTFYTDRTLPCVLERWQNYEIDDADDLLVCEAMMRRHMPSDAQVKTASAANEEQKP